MKKKIVAFIVFMFFSQPSTLQADIWGGDVLVLGQILVNAIEQLSQLRAILGSGKDTLGLLQGINKGINDSLYLLKTVDPNIDPGIYKDLQRASDALQKIQELYGIVVPSKDAQAQHNTDQSVAEAITFNNSIYEYTKEIDDIGEEIKTYSHVVSPGGAQKLTAQTLGIMLHVLNQSLRAQATGLKLQAEMVAQSNHREKEATRVRLKASEDLSRAMTQEKTDYPIPRFK